MNAINIKNLQVYNAGMKKSLLDKIFFMDKIDATVFVDYGCADGTLINFLRNLFPEFEYYGFDISEEMIQVAQNSNKEIKDNFSTNWDYIESQIKGKKSCVICSSIIHEIYSYGTINDVDVFWSRIFGNEFDYIVIRDMLPGKSIDRRSDINDVSKVLKKAKKEALSNFESFWGSIENNKSLIHYFLKYRYTDNWSREVKENYMPITREELLSELPDNYEITYHEHFILPFLKTKVEEDFGIELKDNTHLKLILKRVKNEGSNNIR